MCKMYNIAMCRTNISVRLFPFCFYFLFNVFSVSGDENSFENASKLTEDKVLELIESAYPNPITVQDIAK